MFWFGPSLFQFLYYPFMVDVKVPVFLGSPPAMFLLEVYRVAPFWDDNRVEVGKARCS
jgi:hypothetical protein